jgi:uncharacterized protein YggE
LRCFFASNYLWVMSRILEVMALTAVLVAPSSAQTQPDSVPRIPVVVTAGEGLVMATPDRAFVTLLAEGRSREPREAQKQSASAMSAIQDRLRSAGVQKDAIRTVVYSLQQEFDYVNGRQTPRGYVARHAIEVTLDDMSRVGEILDATVASGASSVSQIRFDLKDRDKAEREALRLAVADARARAEAAAAGVGSVIERVMKIEEVRLPIRRPMPGTERTMAMQAAPETPIAEGQLEIRAQVTLTAAIR